MVCIHSYRYSHIRFGTIEDMLECTWNDAEAELALRRMMLKEKKEQELLANDPKRRQQIRDAVVSHAAAVGGSMEHDRGDTN